MDPDYEMGPRGALRCVPLRVRFGSVVGTPYTDTEQIRGVVADNDVIVNKLGNQSKAFKCIFWLQC